MLFPKHAPDDLIAFGGGGARSFRQLLSDAAALAACLPEAFEDSHALVVIRKDRYAFVVSMLAASARGHAVMLAPDAERQDLLRWVHAPGTAVVLHDTLSGAPLRVDKLLAGRPDAPRADLLARMPVLPRFKVWRRDRHGAERVACRHPPQLWREAEALRRALELGGGLRFLSTIPPEHHYGLLGGVLLPLISGGALSRDIQPGPEGLSPRIGQQRPDVLLSVPAHLTALCQGPPAVQARVATLVSSLAALGEDRLRGLQPHAGRVFELLGSTEAGFYGVRQPAHERAYRPLSGIEVEVNAAGQLQISSPFLAETAHSPHASRERGERAGEGAFLHRGPAHAPRQSDAPSPALLEAQLRSVSAVRDVAIAVQTADDGRARFLMVVVGEKGAEAAAEAFLKPRWATAWGSYALMQVPCLPLEESGKLSRRRLYARFGLHPDGRPVNFSLAWGAESGRSEEGGEQRLYHVHIPPDYGYFVGHFPGYPILPAAAQLSAFVLPCVRRARGELGRLVQMSRLKFLDRIQPDDQVQVELAWRAAGGGIDFALRTAGRLCSSGTLTFEGCEASP